MQAKHMRTAIRRAAREVCRLGFGLAVTAAAAHAADDSTPDISTSNPWTETIEKLAAMFTGPIATAVSIIAIVIGGLMFAFGEGGAKKAVAGLIIGIGMALGATELVEWLR